MVLIWYVRSIFVCDTGFFTGGPLGWKPTRRYRFFKQLAFRQKQFNHHPSHELEQVRSSLPIKSFIKFNICLLIASSAATNSASKPVITRSPPLTTARTYMIRKVANSICLPHTGPTNSRFAWERTRTRLVVTLLSLLRALARHTAAPNCILM
jgi:hypothetical protein